jgi:oligopeptidase B
LTGTKRSVLQEAAEPLKPPVAKRVAHELTSHGDTRVDEYYWMREREDPDVVAYLEAENKYTEAVMKPTEELQKKLYDEILGRIQETDLSVPVKRDDYFYYARTEQGRAYPIFCRRHGSADGAEQLLLDMNQLAEGLEYMGMGNFAVSPDHRLLAYSTDSTGDEVFTIFVKNLDTGELLADRIENTYYTLEWANDNRTFFYTTLDEAKRPWRVWRHVLGRVEDELVYEETDGRFHLVVVKTRSDAYIFVHIASPLTSETRWLRADDPGGEFAVLLPRQQGVEYDAYHQGDWFYIRTNERAKNFRLMRMPVTAPAKENLTEVIAGRDKVTIEAIDCFADFLVIYERDKGLERMRVDDLAGGGSHYIEFPEPVYTASAGENAEYRTQTLRFVYESLVTPRSVFDYDMRTRRRELKKQYAVLGGYDPAKYQSERIFATAADGTEVPISLVYRRGVERTGANPTLLYGYGAYGLTSDPHFSSDRLSLLDRGFIFALAHIRGGGDLGKFWHEAGRLASKTNTFTDFIASAEHLIGQRYTSAHELAINGGSAGGLLIGAVVNLRPDLFGAAVTRVPYVDTLTTGLDSELPLTIGEWEEWGNPVEERAVYEYIKSYSPYDNVRPQSYPAMLVTTGLNDPRVSYWEPAKFVARLRALKTDDHVLLLKTNMGAGHFGASGRYEHMKETAFDYAFLIAALDVPFEPRGS